MKNTWLKEFFKFRSRYKVAGVKWSTCLERVGSCCHCATLLATTFRKSQYFFSPWFSGERGRCVVWSRLCRI